ncbi:hypothetical protein SAMN04488523_107194 [Sulfitobacter brevis]|uniref:Transferrin-binding protein B C-lobe/N-lobe beta barrel domain-containing protein n=1 Tax=Sulfitobacter brevis TaxID=74348 RepID=A0A1I2AU33_9RHOB|nr:hypothetical protein [Sulfitobacter brevis]SFE47346.1 hypothetical protein SAMN04488523_107194 [Sulfitobacter brevis]
MKLNLVGLLLCTVLAGCGGTAPFGEKEESTDTGTTDPDANGGTIESDRTVPPGTASPQPSSTIFRKEPESPTGNGFAQNIRYDSVNDTFAVDNLPFDGGADTPYQRGDAVSSFGTYAVYEALRQYPDSANNTPINQFRHRAIYGVSRSGETEFAIVRTGAYSDYGFGGFVYERNGTVTLPTSGQAIYNGSGAGLRDREGNGGLEYSTSNVQIAIDFDDFDAATGRYEGAVDGFLFDRRVFNLEGEEITNDVLGRINAENNSSLTAIPTAVFTVKPNALDKNGEIVGAVTSRFNNNDGDVVAYETGQYYAIISGEQADEIVGIIVTETTRDPVADKLRDTTGFTIYREAQN